MSATIPEKSILKFSVSQSLTSSISSIELLVLLSKELSPEGSSSTNNVSSSSKSAVSDNVSSGSISSFEGSIVSMTEAGSIVFIILSTNSLFVFCTGSVLSVCTEGFSTTSVCLNSFSIL